MSTATAEAPAKTINGTDQVHAPQNGDGTPQQDTNTTPPDLKPEDASPEAQAEQQPRPDVNGAPSTDEAKNGAGTGEGGIKGLKHKVTDQKDKLTDQKDKLIDKTKGPPGGYDPTPLPDFPSGWTVKFVMHKATNLPAADLSTQSADPFIHATLTAPIPHRHQEDPLLTKRTKTIRKTTEPEWEESWIVANVPSAGFRFKCRIYDEDYPDHNDRLGNVTVVVPHIDENYSLGPDGQWFEAKKRMGSKRAYFFKAVTSTLEKGTSMTPRLHLSIDVIGRSEGKGSQMYTVGPTSYFKHFSPMIGRLMGIKVNKDEQSDGKDHTDDEGKGDRSTKKYDFQANEIQLSGPVPEHMYHRYVEFKPFVAGMFTSKGLRGKVLHKALRKQHARIYNFDASTEYGEFKPCSSEASLQFLKMAHFDEGGRIFTYVLTLDGLLRFTETGKEFGVDMLSKHTMHSDVATYIACSGEFFIRRLAHPDGPNQSDAPDPHEPTHPNQPLPGGPPHDAPPPDPRFYQLIIDNDSGTYRPDKSILPNLREFLQRNFPEMGITTMDGFDEKLAELKKQQRDVKKKEGKTVNMVLNRSPTDSSFSSDDQSRLQDIESADGLEGRHKSKKEKAWDVVEDPHRLKTMVMGSGKEKHEVKHDVGPSTAVAET